MEKKKNISKDKNVKSIVLTVSGIILAIAEYFALVYGNLLLYNFGNFLGMLILIILPLLSIAVFILGSILFFSKKDIKYIVAIGLTLICSVSAFALSNTGSSSKISSDFLKNELEFNNTAQKFILYSTDENGNVFSDFYDVHSKNLKHIINCQKAEVISIDNDKSVVFFYAFENESRIEGYAYLPQKVYPIAWDANITEWSDPLDINETWWYICIYK